MKICTKCEIEKELIYFSKRKSAKDGYKSNCKSCDKLYKLRNRERDSRYNKEYYVRTKSNINRKEYNKEYYINNKDKLDKNNMIYYHKNINDISAKRKIYYKENEEELKEYIRIYREENMEDISEKMKIYRVNNKESIKLNYIKNREINNKKRRKKYRNNSLYRMSCVVRSSVSSYIKNGGYVKESNTNNIIGCNFDYLILYLNSNKYGFKYQEDLYDIDHIIPLSSACNEYELLELFHYSNLQLLPNHYNRYIKSDRDWDIIHFEYWLENNSV